MLRHSNLFFFPFCITASLDSPSVLLIQMLLDNSVGVESVYSIHLLRHQVKSEISLERGREFATPLSPIPFPFLLKPFELPS